MSQDNFPPVDDGNEDEEIELSEIIDPQLGFVLSQIKRNRDILENFKLFMNFNSQEDVSKTLDRLRDFFIDTQSNVTDALVKILKKRELTRNDLQLIALNLDWANDLSEYPEKIRTLAHIKGIEFERDSGGDIVGIFIES